MEIERLRELKEKRYIIEERIIREREKDRILEREKERG